MSWRIAGSYFESCNCAAICPCRMIGGVLGGRSTYGICYGVISWLVEEGQADGIPLSGLGAVLVIRYDDDELGSPWRMVLHVDERGDGAQRTALEDILLGRLGGPHILELPWVRKPSEVLDVRASPIEIGDRSVRVGSAIRLTASRPVETRETVACVIAGYDRPGTELYADEHFVRDAPYEWELDGSCAFATTFDYASQ